MLTALLHIHKHMHASVSLIDRGESNALLCSSLSYADVNGCSLTGRQNCDFLTVGTVFCGAIGIVSILTI